MYLAYKKDDIYVKIVACLFISCFIVMCFMGSVYAQDTTFQVGNNSFTINYNNKSAKFGNRDVLTDLDIWNYNIAILVNNSNIFTLLYKGNLTCKQNYYFELDYSQTYYTDTGNYSNVDFYPKRLSSFSSSTSNRVSSGYIQTNLNDLKFVTSNVYNANGDIIHIPDITQYPQITTSLEDLQTLNFDTISVSAWDWSDKDLYTLFYDRTLMNNENTEGLYPKKEIKLTKDTSYYIPEISSEENAIYWIANDNTGLNFKVGGKYEIRLAERVPQSTGRRLSWR